jgi:cephalosporin-C deacetylase-like acetyl esterase
MELVEAFAKFFAERGYTTIGFYRREMYFDPREDIEYNKHLFQQSVIDVRRAIDFLQQQPGVDADRIAIMGASLGGIIGALATEADPRLKATVMMISAGDLPMILDRSNYSRVYRFRQSIIKRYHLQREDVYKFGCANLREVDPLTYASRIDPRRLLMINGSIDTIIPLAAAHETWEAFGRPEWRILPVSHYSSMLMIDYAQRVSLSHFRKVMKRQAD